MSLVIDTLDMLSIFLKQSTDVHPFTDNKKFGLNLKAAFMSRALRYRKGL